MRLDNLNRGIGLVFLLFLLLLTPLPHALAASPLLDEVSVDSAQIRKIMTKNFFLEIDGKKFTVPVKTLKNFVSLRESGDRTMLKLKAWHIYDFLNVYVSPNINDEGQNARFVNQGGVWVFLSPGREGKIADGVKTSLAIRSALVAGNSSSKIYMKKYLPPVTSEKDFKKLGLNTVIAEGTTSFRGSPANRVKNIDVGKTKLQGLLVAPNAEFSLNKMLGPIDEKAGFVPELVIKEQVTKPEYGGGLCQISTTLFRAVLSGGFRVTERHNHAYPVKYYGTPGFDATIYSPRPDLRFVNNTGNWILLQGKIEGSKLTFQIYGKPDGRKVKIDGPHVVEKKPDGSIRTLLREIVTDKSGKEIINKLFPSEYKSPDLFPIVRKENGESGTIKP